MNAAERERPTTGTGGRRPRSGHREALRSIRAIATLASGVAFASLVSSAGLVAEGPVLEQTRRTAQPKYSVVQVTDGGSVSGQVKLDAVPELPRMMTASTNQDVCGNELADPSVAVGPDGQLQWAFVSLEGLTQGKAFSRAPLRLSNQGCIYVPHVQGAPAGAEIEIVNGDDVLHNTHTYLGRRTIFNIALPIKDMKVKKALPQTPGPVSIKCDAHEWMGGWVHVMSHPYFATTDETGAFRIDDVPAGSYTLVAWHEHFGEVRQPVEVKNGQAVRRELVLSGNGAVNAGH